MVVGTKRPPDKTLTAMVQEVLTSREGRVYGFKVVMGDGTSQKFTLGNRVESCPPQGTSIRISYNVTPGNDEYPDPTWWCNTWEDTNSAASGTTPTSEPNPYEAQGRRIDAKLDAYEAKARELEAQEQAQNAAPIRRFDKEESISMAVCIRWVTEAQIANLAAAVSHPETDSRSLTITPQTITLDAEALYQAVFVIGSSQEPVGDGSDPGPEGP